MNRYPLAPLARRLHIELGQVGGYQPDAPPAGLAALAEVLGVSHKWAQKLAQYGLTERTADRMAVRAGFHPSTVWPEWVDNAPGEEFSDEEAKEPLDDWYLDDPDFAEVLLDRVAS